MHLTLLAQPLSLENVSRLDDSEGWYANIRYQPFILSISMAALFSKVIPKLLEIEGVKYTNNPQDRGGETKFGISKKQYSHLDIRNLTEAIAVAIYEKDYWLRYRLNEIEDQVTANQIFFLIINMDPLKAIEIVQEAVNSTVEYPRLKVDGVLGSVTIAAINSVQKTMGFWVNDGIRIGAIRYYLAVTDRDNSQVINFRGWVRRALS